MGCVSSHDPDNSRPSSTTYTTIEAKDDINYKTYDKNPNKYVSDNISMHISIRDVIGSDIDSQSDPFVVVSEMDYSTESFKEIGRTETIENNHDCDFTKCFIVPYIFNVCQIFRFDVYDSDDKSDDLSKHDYLGSATFNLGEIIHENGSIQTKKLLSKQNKYYVNKETKKYSTISIYVDTERDEQKSEMVEKFISFDIHGSNVSTSYDTYLLIHRIDSDNRDVKVYQSDVVRHNNPNYGTVNVDTYTLSHGKLETILKFQICRYYENKNNVVAHTETMSMKELVESNKTINRGKIRIENIWKSMYTFTDYLYGAYDLNVIFGIDFTASNGDPEEPYSLHYIYDKHKLNPYQVAIRSVGNILSSYDSDQLFECYGFGAKVIEDSEKIAHTQFAFPLNSDEKNPSIQGIFNIEKDYYKIVKNKEKYILSSPTNFAPMLRKVIRIGKESVNNNENKYFIFVIMTDGQITDMKQTIELIKQISNEPLPISIIIVGVGDDNFDSMEQLDGDDIKIGNRDVVQFVEMQKYINKSNGNIDKERLTMDVLYEVPTQLLSYMKMTGKTPNLEKHNNKPLETGSLYDVNIENDEHNIDNKDEEKDESIQTVSSMIIEKDTPIPFGWEKCYDLNGNIYLIDDKGRQITPREFFNTINTNYNDFALHSNNTSKNWNYPEVDLIICMDVTASMTNEINQTKDEIINIVERVRNAENAHLRFGYVAYRDHKDDFVVKSHPFTSNGKKMKEYVGLYNASGGGDIPEALAAGLKECVTKNKFQFREKAVKMIVVITDAPPHGIGYSSDSYPKGCPQKNDLIRLVKIMRDEGILLYVLGCEPDLKSDRTRDVYMALSEMTFGRCYGIIDCDIMDEVITRSIQEEINIMKCQYMVKHEMDEKECDDEQLVKELLMKHSFKKKYVEFDDAYKNRKRDNVDIIMNECSNIENIRKKWKSNVKQSSLPRKQSKTVKLIDNEDIDDEFVKKIIAKNKLTR